MPEDVWRRLKLFGLSFDVSGHAADWTPVREAVAEWVKLHEQKGRGHLLGYRDGGSFLIVEDRRFGDFRQGRFSSEEREIYLDCTEIRSFRDVAGRHRALGLSEVELRAMLQRFVEDKIMYAEDDKYLSLAVASRPQLAAERIRRSTSSALAMSSSAGSSSLWWPCKVASWDCAMATAISSRSAADCKIVSERSARSMASSSSMRPKAAALNDAQTSAARRLSPRPARARRSGASRAIFSASP